MLRTNQIIISAVLGVLGVTFAVSNAFAFNPIIQTLPTFINTDSFKLSCTANGINAQFYVNKKGAGFVPFGSSIDLSTSQCLIQVTSSQVNDEGDYSFKVIVDGVESNMSSTIYDHSGPSTPNDYYKEELADGFKIHWKNPSDSDFSKVIIYRGESVDFPADSSHEITNQPGGAGNPMTFEDHFTKINGKTYYYDLRAVDKAGNSSDLIGDGNKNEVAVSQGSSNEGAKGKVTILPNDSKGTVLGSETKSEITPSGTAAFTENKENKSEEPNTLRWILSGILAGLISASFLNYYKKNRKDNIKNIKKDIRKNKKNK